MVIDGEAKAESLFKLVKGTNLAVVDPENKASDDNTIIAFHDNSSSIKGFPVRASAATYASAPGAQYKVEEKVYHGILTCETHNFPCGIAPFPGAETGTGGRLRDVQGCGRGGIVVAGTSSYCVGNLNIPGYNLPWEDGKLKYPSNMATPLDIEVQASNGASDYGNKFGEPVVSGYTRSFGMVLPNGERREWIKPIMMSAGVGLLDGRHVDKGSREEHGRRQNWRASVPHRHGRRRCQ